ncbi:hypothetical protein PVAND_013298 [Polypedilum vanderplanki]|uniref:Uncharacterized protein n=1 Tax=Polypedilum vanderplanki TaxID=319348 RepID=A0A9J6CQ95_POLVA|nr:hypothetical protein PVAND_013298 [Polypedilum vanderplanki]
MKSVFVSIFVIVCITRTIVSVPLKNGDTACIARYLINNNVISASAVEKLVKADDTAENCVDKINLANREFFRQLSKKSTGDKKVDSCIATTLQRNNVTNLIFKEILMFHISDNKEFQVLKDLKTIKKRFFDTAELICRHQDIFAPNINEKFDSLAQNNVDINDIYEFNEIKHCVKKFIVFNDVVKVDENKVDIQPKNIDQEDLDELNCKEVVDDLYNTMTKDIEEILLPSPASRFVKTSCVVMKAEKFNFLEKMFSYVFLIHSNLSKQNKSLVRRKADETEPSVERWMLDCIELY